MKCRVVWNWCNLCLEVVGYLMEDDVFVLIFDDDDVFVVGYLVVYADVVFSDY